MFTKTIVGIDSPALKGEASVKFRKASGVNRGIPEVVRPEPLMQRTPNEKPPAVPTQPTVLDLKLQEYYTSLTNLMPVNLQNRPRSSVISP